MSVAITSRSSSGTPFVELTAGNRVSNVSRLISKISYAFNLASSQHTASHRTRAVSSLFPSRRSSPTSRSSD